MKNVNAQEFSRLSRIMKFIELEFDVSITKSNDMKFFGTEIGPDVLLVGVYNCDICSMMQIIRNACICKCEDKYVLQYLNSSDTGNDNIFYSEDVLDIPPYAGNQEDLVNLSQVSTDDDNILDEQMASYSENAEKPVENTFNASIAARFSPEAGAKMKSQMDQMVKAVQKTAKEATKSVNYEQIAKRMDDVVKETMKPIHDMVNPKVINEIEPKFNKAKEEMISAQEEKPINPTPVVTTGRRINKPEEKKKPEFKVQKKEKPQREVVRATDYVEPQPVKKGYWD